MQKHSSRYKKRLGQHFLNSKGLVKKIVDFAEIENEIVLEIGSGKGILTRQIAQGAKKVFAVEIDKKLAQVLERMNLPNIIIINNDFLKLDLKNYQNPVVVGNIPYSITTRIFEKLIEQRNCFKRAVLTIQKEYGQRILAKVNSRQYGMITLYVNYYYQINKAFVIQSRYFSPQPKVSSVVISLTRKKPRFALKDDKAFFEFIKGIFCYRRKSLKNALISHLHELPEHIDKKLLGKRPQNLALNDFYRIYKNLVLA